MPIIAFYQGRQFLGEHHLCECSTQAFRNIFGWLFGYIHHDRQIIDHGRVIIRKIRPGTIKIRHIPGKSESETIHHGFEDIII